MAASLLAAAVWRGEPTAVHPVAVKRMWQRLSLEALAFFLAAELIPAYIRSTVERLLTSVFRWAVETLHVDAVELWCSPFPRYGCCSALTTLLHVLLAEAYVRNAVCTDGGWELPAQFRFIAGQVEELLQRVSPLIVQPRRLCRQPDARTQRHTSLSLQNRLLCFLHLLATGYSFEDLASRVGLHPPTVHQEFLHVLHTGLDGLNRLLC